MRARASGLAAVGSAVVLAAAPWAGGCPGVCEGAGCQELYNRADLVRLRGAGLAGEAAFGGEVAELSAGVDGEVLIEGAEGEGYAWGVLAAPGWLAVGQPEAGAVRLWAVGAEGLEGAGALIQSAEAESFGASLARVGGKLAVGAPRHAPATGGGDAGAIYLFSDPAGIAAAGGVVEVAARLEGRLGERLGARLAECADLDGDGGGDALVQAEWGDEGGALSGEVWLLRSGDAASIVAGELARDTLVLLPGQGSITGARLGAGLACRDPLGESEDQPDVVAGAPFASVGGGFGLEAVQGVGQVLIWAGGAGLGAEDPLLRLVGTEEAEYFGYAVATGDLDGDGETDLAVGAPGHDPRLTGDAASGVGGMAGAVYVYTAEKISYAIDFGFPGAPVEPAYVLSRRHEAVASDCGGLREEALDDCENAHFARLGASVAIADLDGDGVGDLVVGAPGWRQDNAVEAGRIWVLAGPAERWVPDIVVAPTDTWRLDIDRAARQVVTGGAAFEQAGAGLSVAGEAAFGQLGAGSDLLILLRRQ